MGVITVRDTGRGVEPGHLEHIFNPFYQTEDADAAVRGGMGLGSLNELIEFAATLTVPETNVGGYINTGWDLVSNCVGALTAVTLIWIHDRYRRPATASADVG